jgi:hypothetical protein
LGTRFFLNSKFQAPNSKQILKDKHHPPAGGPNKIKKSKFKIPFEIVHFESEIRNNSNQPGILLKNPDKTL